MKNCYALLLLTLALLGSPGLFAQDLQRYIDEVFLEVEVTPGIEYSMNATVITLGTEIAAPTRDTLLLDFYQPQGDTVSERPLVVMMPTGNFLPIGVNQSTLGVRDDSVNVEIAHRLARRGYAVASIDYRHGWNPSAPSQPDRTLSLIQAAYRGIQDVRAAIRFFRRDYAENDNSFQVDTSRIVLWGIGTGGYLSLGATVLDDFNKIPNTQFPQGKYTFEFPPGSGTFVPMVIPQVNGDIYGFGVPEPEDTIVAAPPFVVPPLEEGDTLNFPNHLGYSSDFHLAVNMGGAMPDLSWLEDDHVPIITFHVPTDPFAPYEDGVLIVPTTGDPVVRVQGGVNVAQRANELGINAPFQLIRDEFADRPDLLAITDRASDASSRANGDSGPHDYFEGLYPFLRETNEFGEEEGSPWNWWEPAVWSNVPALDPDFDNLHELGLQNNADMSKEKAMAYIDTIMWYFTPRAYLALNLASSSTEELLDPARVDLKIMPNPATDRIFLTSGEGYPMREVLVFDLNGRLVQAHSRLEAFQLELPRQGLPPGMYVVKVGFDEGVAAKKVLFR